jgi:hypothetical protein
VARLDVAEGAEVHVLDETVLHADRSRHALERDVRQLDDEPRRIFAHEGGVDRVLRTAQHDASHPGVVLYFDGGDRLHLCTKGPRLQRQGGQCERSDGAQRPHRE